MVTRSRILFFEALHIVHERVSFGLGCRASRGGAFVLEMGLVHSWSWHLGEFLSNEVCHLLTTGIAFLLGGVFFDEAGLVVASGSRGGFSKTKVCLSELPSDLAPGVCSGFEVCS